MTGQRPYFEHAFVQNGLPCALWLAPWRPESPQSIPAAGPNGPKSAIQEPREGWEGAGEQSEQKVSKQVSKHFADFHTQTGCDLFVETNTRSNQIH